MKIIDKIFVVAAIIALVMLGIKYLDPGVFSYYCSFPSMLLRDNYFRICIGVITAAIAWIAISKSSTPPASKVPASVKRDRGQMEPVYNCNECGLKISASQYEQQESCAECGAKFEKNLAGEQKKSDEKVEINPLLIACVSCSHQFSKRANKCPKCGWHPSLTCQSVQKKTAANDNFLDSSSTVTKK